MTKEHTIEHPGDTRHPEHEEYLRELGRATYWASRLAGISFDILRVFGGDKSASMYDDPLGKLENKLVTLSSRRNDLPGIVEFLRDLKTARNTRNDLIHALPVQHGLHRRRTNNLHYVRNFFTIQDLQATTDEFRSLVDKGSALLYHDGGAAIRAWYQIGGN
jgi:hypothetical protein